MVRKIAFLGLLIATIAFLGTGCCTEQKCQDQFGESLCTKDRCKEIHDLRDPYPPVGPDITLEDDGTGNNTLKWKDGEHDLPPDPAVSVFENWPDEPCLLRSDFIGTLSVKFKFHKGPLIVGPAQKVTVSNADVDITMERGLWDTIRWTIKDKTTTPPRICRAFPTGVFDAAKVPMELGGLKTNTLKHNNEVDPGIKVDLQVYWP